MTRLAVITMNFGIIKWSWLLFIVYLLLVGFIVPVWATNDTTQSTCVPPTCDKCADAQAQAKCRYETLFGKEGAGYATESPTANIPARIGIVVDVVMTLTGMIFLAIVVFSGIQWMSAGGNEEQVKKAKTRITRATTGLILVVGAWALVNFVLSSLLFPGTGTSFGWGMFEAGTVSP